MASSQIIVDTDVLIDFLRGKEKAKLLLQKALTLSDLACSVITLAEIIAGMRTSEKNATEKLLSGLSILPVNESIGRLAGELRQKFKNILLPDCLIAATCLENSAHLLTFNKKDYPFKEIIFF